MGNSTVQPPTHRARLTGPLILIALGVMFLLGEFIPAWGVGKTWPVLLVLIGVLKLLESSRAPRPPGEPHV